MQTSTLACIHKHIYLNILWIYKPYEQCIFIPYIDLCFFCDDDLGNFEFFQTSFFLQTPKFVHQLDPKCQAKPSPTWTLQKLPKVPTLMVQKSGDHQLRLVFYPIIYVPGGDHQISEPSTHHHHHHAWPILAHVFLLCYAAS